MVQHKCGDLRSATITTLFHGELGVVEVSKKTESQMWHAEKRLGDEMQGCACSNISRIIVRVDLFDQQVD